MASGWRERDEDILEGYHRDRTGGGAFEDACIVLWSLIVLAWLIFIVIPYRLVRWAFAPHGRITTTKAAPKHREEGKDEYGRDIWRYGR